MLDALDPLAEPDVDAGSHGIDDPDVAAVGEVIAAPEEEKPVIDMMAKYDMVPRYIDTVGYRKSVEAFIVSEKAALEKIGLAKKE